MVAHLFPRCLPWQRFQKRRIDMQPKRTIIQVAPVFAALAISSLGVVTQAFAAPSPVKTVVTQAHSAPAGIQHGTTPVNTIDWHNRPYTTTCADLSRGPFTVNLKNGKGEAPGIGTSDYDSFQVAVEALATGDLTGDGRDETAVLLACTPQPSNFYVEEVQVFGPDGKAVGTLPQVPAESKQPLPPQYDPGQFSIRDGALATGMKFYAPTDSHAGGPTIHRTLIWHWNGHAFTH
jgi:hypothetical protein